MCVSGESVCVCGGWGGEDECNVRWGGCRRETITERVVDPGSQLVAFSTLNNASIGS